MSDGPSQFRKRVIHVGMACHGGCGVRFTRAANVLLVYHESLLEILSSINDKLARACANAIDCYQRFLNVDFIAK
jgi:hypothetical protein